MRHVPIKLDPDKLVGDGEMSRWSNKSLGVYVRILARCAIDGGLTDTDLEKAAEGLSNREVEAIRSRLVAIGHALTDAEILAARSKRLAHVATNNAHTRERASARAPGGGGVLRTQTQTPPPTPGDERVIPNSEEWKIREIARTLARVREKLDDDEFMFVKRAMDFCEREHRTGRQRSLNVRYEYWCEIGKFHPLQFGYACHEFVRFGCIESGKGFRYLMGICRKSAASWFVEYRASKSKETGEFSLEG
jgi:hypothetical protein